MAKGETDGCDHHVGLCFYGGPFWRASGISVSSLFLSIFTGIILLAAGAFLNKPAAADARLDEVENRLSKLESRAKADCTIDPKKRIGVKCPNWSASMFGRLYVDVMAFSEDKPQKDAEGRRLEDTSNTRIRAARIGIAGKYQNLWGFKVEADVSSNSKSQLKDAYLSYIGVKKLKINAGQAKVPYSMEELTSSRHINFIERVTPSGFSPGRVIVLAAFYGADDWSFGASFHGEGHDDKGDKETYQADWGVTTRGSWAPLYEKGKHYIHLGAGLRLVNYPSQDKTKIGYTTRSPFSNAFDFKAAKGLGLSRVDEVGGVGAGKVVKSGADEFTVAFEDMLGWNAELAGGYGPVGFKVQYIRADADAEAVKIVGNPDRRGLKGSYDFDSWYVEGNWWMTGESNAYEPKKGTFARIKPLNDLGNGGIGAVGVAVRYNEVEFGDKKDMAYLKCDDGCAANAWTLNLTWKPNPHIKFMGEYVRAERERIGIDDGFKDTPNAFQLRLMVDF